MTSIQNVAEYYDELYPVTAEQKDFYARIGKNYPPPARFLQIGCGTGSLEHVLVKDGADVTGLEVSKELIEIAALRRRTQLMPIRFFQLSTLDMTRFLGKNFYNVISCLNSRIAFIKDKTLLKKFFFDCKALLSEGGSLVLHLYNFSTVLKGGTTALPCRSSIRVKLSSSVSAGKDDKFSKSNARNRQRQNSSRYAKRRTVSSRKRRNHPVRAGSGVYGFFVLRLIRHG